LLFDRVIFYSNNEYATRMELFLAKVRMARIVKSMSQEFIAHELGMSQSAYSKLEKGQTCLGFIQAIRLAKLLDIDLLEIIRECLSHTHTQTLSCKSAFYLTSAPFSNPASGLTNISFPLLSSAIRIMPWLITPFSLRGSRLHSTVTCLPITSSVE
jgi:transcriptional regulator with XRE-family HTH domain